jgi:hypothetical protein
MSTELMQAFAEIGAELQIEHRARRVEIDVQRDADREVFVLRRPEFATITAEAIDVRPHHRHLVLDVYGAGLPVSGRFLCGHDEQHWFVASVPFGMGTRSVRGAMEALKPQIVRREQKRKGVSHRRRHRRKTEAYVRQGEWFFLPRPQMHVHPEQVERNGRLAREGGKPHRVEWIYAIDETLRFARGVISHPDHAPLHLHVWHRIVQNAEPAPQPQIDEQSFVHMAFSD